MPTFLSRPRRFGKSLLVSTLRAYFEGRSDLFEGLEIERLEEAAAEREGREPWVTRPVFHLDFNGADYTREGSLEAKLDALLRRLEEKWDTDGSSLEAGDRFQNLLEAAHAQSGHRVVVLVDEYDKPLLDAVEDPSLEGSNRAALKGFFSVLKGADEHLCLAFLTGVTKFSKVSIFSDLNQLRDISLERDYAGVCGITEAELESTFEPEIEALADQLGLSPEGCLEALRAQYDGYCFHPDGPGDSRGVGRMVYNPFSLLNAFQSRRLGSWWFESGTPTFLVRRMREVGLDPRRLTDGSIHATERRLSDYRGDDPDPIPLMFQAGYLTIRAADPATDEYALAVPNGEVRYGLVESLLPAWAPGYSEARGTDVYTLRRLVEAGDADGMRDVLAALFASIPYTREDDPFENYFQAVIWLVFTLLRRYVRCEVHQARGRADVVIEVREHVYVMELKRDGTAAEALAQIEEHGYAEPFSADERKLHLIGCAFDPKTRRLAEWEER
ncbi:MAG: ATP-binding protein [Olsenella sp.]|nr:ATP-binding protein [Olsenella sp.]